MLSHLAIYQPSSKVVVVAEIYGRLVPYGSDALNASTILGRELPPSTAFAAILITIAIFQLDATHLPDEGKLKGNFIQFLDYVLRFHACIVLLSIYNIDCLKGLQQGHQRPGSTE